MKEELHGLSEHHPESTPSQSSQSAIQVLYLRDAATKMCELSLPFDSLSFLSLYFVGFYPFRGKNLFEKPREAIKILWKMQARKYYKIF